MQNALSTPFQKVHSYQEQSVLNGVKLILMDDPSFFFLGGTVIGNTIIGSFF